MGCFDLLICKSIAAGRQPEMYCAVEKEETWLESHKRSKSIHLFAGCQ